MLKMLLFILLAVCINHGFGNVNALFVGAFHGKTLSIDHIYPFPGNSTPRFAFCCNHGKTIIVYDGMNHRTKVFEPASGGLMANTYETLSFVTFCWDLEGNNAFTAVYAAEGKKRIFYGKAEGFGKAPETLRNPDEISDKAVSFNFRGGKLSYIDLGKGDIYELTRGYSPRRLYRKPGGNRTVTYYKISPSRDVPPYFVLRNTRLNDSGIFKGGNFTKVVDKADRDELYPHISDDGTLLGYIERDPREGKAVICLGTPSGTRKSRKSFALEENALLREYNRMFFIGNILYYYIDVPDVFAAKTPPGLASLAQRRGEQILQRHTEIVLRQNDECLNLLNGEVCRYESFYLQKEEDLATKIYPPTYKMVPYRRNNNMYILIFTRFDSEIIAKKGKDSWNKLIDTVILAPWED